MRAALSIPPARGEPGLMGQLGRIKALAGNHERHEAITIAESIGAKGRVLDAVKAAVPAHAVTDDDLTGLVDARYITTQFIPFLGRSSAFYYLFDAGGMNRVPLRTRVSWTTATATAFVVGEGAAVPVSRVGVDGLGVQRRRVSSLIILTDKMLRSMGVSGEGLISREIRRGMAKAVDEVFFDVAIDSATPTIASAGNDAWATAIDLRALNASTLVTSTGAFAFPDMGATGGDMLGIPAIVCDALEAGTLALVDGTGFVGDAELITIDASNDTSVEMVDDPTNNSVTPTATTMVSMFQTNSTALLGTAWFGVHRIRDNALALLTDVAWGEDVSGS